MSRNVLYATLEKKGIPIKFDEARKIPGEEIPAKSSLQISQKSNVDRNSILERLKLNKVLVTSCKVPDKKIIEEEAEAEEEEEEDLGKKEVITLKEEDDDDDDADFLQEKEEKQDVNNTEVLMPKENPGDMEIENTDSKSIFAICANTKAAPGAATHENISKPDNFKELASHDDWRGKLCNTFPLESFEIEGIKWNNIHHYLIYAKYRPQNEILKQALIDSYEIAVGAEKTGTMMMKNEKGKNTKTTLTVDPEFESAKSNLLYHALYVKFSTNPELMKILYLTYPAKLVTVRRGKDTEHFKELEVLRSQFMPFFRGKFGKETETRTERKQKEKEKEKETGPIKYSEEDLKKIMKRLPKRQQIVMRQNEFYMYNRMKFHNELKILFQKHETAVKNGDDKDIPNELLLHQRVVSEYLNLYTPYRGLLIYHGLGSGKTFTSVAIAEGMKTNKHVVVLLPASLHYNYVAELEKFGEPLYRIDQHWEFVKTEGKDE